jgi:hypothetical protein
MAQQRPYKHSPEEGTAEASDQPWTIYVPVQPMPWPDAAKDAEEAEEPAGHRRGDRPGRGHDDGREAPRQAARGKSGRGEQPWTIHLPLRPGSTRTTNGRPSRCSTRVAAPARRASPQRGEPALRRVRARPPRGRARLQGAARARAARGRARGDRLLPGVRGSRVRPRIARGRLRRSILARRFRAMSEHTDEVDLREVLARLDAIEERLELLSVANKKKRRRRRRRDDAETPRC